MSQIISSTIPKVLLVEDDQPLREVLGEILRKEGYLVDEATSGEQALQLVRQRKYDVVLLDLLFKTTGLQGLSILKRLQLSFPNLPVIVLSGKASDEMVIQTIREGGFSFITKPIHDLENVLLLLQKALKPKCQADFSTQLQAIEIHVKGAPVDIHPYVYRYFSGFNRYLKKVKGVQSSLSIESNFDDVHFFVTAEESKDTILSWFEEYLSYAEKGLPRALAFTTILSWEEQVEYLNYLNTEVKTLREHTSKALRRYYIDPNFGHDLSPYLVYFNPIKVINQIELQEVKQVSQGFILNYTELQSEVQELILQGKTLSALNKLLVVTQKLSLDWAFESVKSLQKRLDDAINNRILGKIKEQALETIIAQVHTCIMSDLLPEIKSQLHLKRA